MGKVSFLFLIGVFTTALALRGGQMLFQGKDIQISPGSSLVLHYQKGEIFPMVNSVVLSNNSEKALKIVPQWLKSELADNLSRLELRLQDKYAQLILKCPDKRYLDEVAFSIAHISPEVLSDPSFEPSLIWENARQIYEADKILDFVQLVEKKDYTTARYFLEIDGEIRAYELPRDYFYWFVVHPQFFTELPRKIGGYFWREYYLNRCDVGYPKLRDYLKGVKVLWDGRTLSISNKQLEERTELLRYALPSIGLWVMKQLPEGKHPLGRPLQPIEVLKGHGGSCTENQTVLACALRACLIPAGYARNFSENHQWVEFFLMDKWHPIQTDMGGSALRIAHPPGISYDRDYGGTKELSSVALVRPDGYIIERVGEHSKTTKVKIKVIDVNAYPMDGVLVRVFTPFYPATSGVCNSLCTYSYTDINGECEFTLGQNRDYLVVVGSEGFPIKSASDKEVYQNTFSLPQRKRLVGGRIYPIAPDKSSPNISIICNPHSYIIYGLNLLPDFRRPEVRPKFSQRCKGGALVVLICDENNFAKYRKGEKFSAYVFEARDKNTHISLRIEPKRDWFIIFHNDAEAAKILADIGVKRN